ncbi:hypothetical protein ACPTJS_15915, partial [Enterococcus faecalis]|uniref:hypothetical protein n=1 Tax=Enterococcus faecalis TaxID=1351 RepID=UPI003CC65B31
SKVYSRRAAQVNPFHSLIFAFVGTAFFDVWGLCAKILYTKTNVIVFYLLDRASDQSDLHRFTHNKIRTAAMSALTLKLAVNLAGQAITAGRTISAAPLTIAVLD